MVNWVTEATSGRRLITVFTQEKQKGVGARLSPMFTARRPMCSVVILDTGQERAAGARSPPPSVRRRLQTFPRCFYSELGRYWTNRVDTGLFYPPVCSVYSVFCCWVPTTQHVEAAHPAAVF